MHTIYIALGSNLGDREKNIKDALTAIQDNNINIISTSTIIETNPVGGPSQGKYLNAVLKASTNLSCESLLSVLQSIEIKLGRQRTIKNGPRTIDLDILLFDNLKIKTENLIVPHPRMWERDFVMIPLKEIEPEVEKIISQ